MGKETGIQWCHHTWNRWRGCRKVAPECLNCYIVTAPPLLFKGQKHGDVRVEAGLAYRQAPFNWNAAAEKAKERRRVFCMSLGDWLDTENVPLSWWVDILDTVRLTPWLDWLLLTKRPQNFNKRMLELAKSERDIATETGAWAMAWEQGTAIPHNVWIGVSAGVDVTPALDIPAPVHFLSCEPMIKPLDTNQARFFDWIIFGGESGHGAREMKLDWLAHGIEFCDEHHIAMFVKQLGENPTTAALGRRPLLAAMKDKKRGDPAEWDAAHMHYYNRREFPMPKLPAKYDSKTYAVPF